MCSKEIKDSKLLRDKMKKFLIALMLFGGVISTVNAQRFIIEDALIAIRNGNYDVAKEKIDEAYENITDKYKAKALKVRGDVYYYISVDTNYTYLDKDAPLTSLKSYIDCIEAERGERRQPYTPDAIKGIPEAAVAVYLKALSYYDKKDYKKTLEYWDLLIKGYEADTTGGVPKRLNTSKNDIIQNCATVSISIDDKAKAKEYLNRLIKDPKYLSPTGYVQLSLMELEKGDTTKALEIIEKGRKKIPDDKTLFNQELNLYTQMGRTDILVKKLDEVIKNEPNNTLYLFYRGAIVNEEAVKIMESAYQYTDSASDNRSKIKTTSNPAKKKAYQDNVKMYLAKRDSIFSVAGEMFKRAEKDYKEALLIDPYYFDALFNLGVMYFNHNKELVNKYNYLDIYSSEDKTKAKKLEEQMKAMLEKALEQLLKAEEVKPEDSDLLFAIQQTYGQLGNSEKSKEYKDKRSGM